MSELLDSVNALIAKVTLAESLKRNAQVKVQNAFAALTAAQQAIDQFNQAVALCDHCISDQIKLKRYFEESTTEFLNKVLIDMAEPTDTPVPRLKYMLEPIEDETGTIIGLKPMVQEEGKEPDNITEFGTSVRNCIGLANRTIAVAVTPGLRPIIIGDEIAVNLHYSVWSRISEYYQDLQRVMGDFQLVLVSNVTDTFPTVYKVEKRGDTSSIRPLNANNEYVKDK